LRFLQGHYLENVGDTDLVVLEMFRSSRFQDVSLSDWLAHTPPALVAQHLNVDVATIAKFPNDKPEIMSKYVASRLWPAAASPAAAGLLGGSKQPHREEKLLVLLCAVEIKKLTDANGNRSSIVSDGRRHRVRLRRHVHQIQRAPKSRGSNRHAPRGRHRRDRPSGYDANRPSHPSRQHQPRRKRYLGLAKLDSVASFDRRRVRPVN
jgi:hypothetical protein